SSDAVALESEAEVAFVYPPDPSFVAALRRAAADPATYHRPNSLRAVPREAEVSASPAPGGGTTVFIRAELEAPASGRWRTGLAAYYRLRWKGRDLAVAILGRTYGGLGRLAEAAAREAENGPLTGLARGGTFGSSDSDARGLPAAEALERAGLKYSAVSGSELEHWADLQAYRRERPGGISYLSANLVYSTMTVSTSSARTVLPPYALFESSGTRVAVVGLTPDSAGPLLSQFGLDKMTVEDPVVAIEALIPRLREKADVVIALGSLDPANRSRLASATRGLDLIVADDAPFYMYSPPPSSVVEQDDRPLYGNPLPTVRAYAPALNVVELSRRDDAGRVDWTVRQSAVLLDDTLNPAEGFPEPALEAYAAGRSTEPALLPPARSVFPPSDRGGSPFYEPRDFWTLAAGLLAERGRAEAGLLSVPPIPVQTVGPVRESFVRRWLGGSDPAVLVSLPGERLKKLADDAAEQRRREAAGLPVDAPVRFVVSGFGPKGLLRGAPLDKGESYRVATSRATADALDLPKPYELIPGTMTVAAAVLDEMRARSAAARPYDWRHWMEGRPIEEPGLWVVNFRDISLNLRDTRTQASDAFDSVVNSRVQGSDELLIGETLKTDLTYLHHEYKWTNTLEMEYAKDRIAPRGQPSVTNVTANRIMLLTLDTKRAGSLAWGWLARSWGPSLGAEFDSEFEPSPGLPRKQVYSVFPGAEFYDGSVVKSLETTGVIKRDLSRTPPNTQTGLRVRALAETTVGPSGATLDAEFWNNYFFLTQSDNASDLRMEGDANAKLSIPIRKYLSVSPFLDFYWFELKTQPTYGYSLMTGVSIGFARLWKPQYEAF
ncbi:MAG TPA: hypothetical protein VH309_00210, partial [Elusimicrobiota bacterium]|nr:hypothetical protein [Elusimicrobiota bacterium]